MHVEGHLVGDQVDVGQHFRHHRFITTARPLHRLLQQQSAEVSSTEGGHRRRQQVPEEGGHQGGGGQQVKSPQGEDHRLHEDVGEDYAEAAGHVEAATGAKVGRGALDQAGEKLLGKKRKKQFF